MRFLVAAAVLLLPGAAAAQLSARAVLDPPQVHVGEAADLSVEITGAQNAPVPQIDAVDGVTVRYVGPSTQVSIVNGQMTASITHRFSVVPTRAGTFTLGPIAVDVGGRRYDAGSVTLTVATGGGAEAGQAAGNQLRLVLSAPKSEVYLHERVPLAVTLMVGNVRVSDLQYPAVPGDAFALDRFPKPEQRRAQTPEGIFEAVEFRTVLTPLRSGTITVGPATMALSLLVRSRRRDPFFGSLFGETARPTELRSEPLTLAVLPLPETERPPDFSGAVGHFDFEVKAAPLEVSAGDPITVTSTIRGAGNLDGVAAPALSAGEGLRVYPVQPAAPGAGAKPDEHVFEQVVVPERAGTMTLPELRFSYFDPDARGYRTILRPGVAVAVRPSAVARTTPAMAGPPAPRPAERLGHDIVSIKDEPGAFRPTGARRHRSPVFWTAQALPLAVWAAAVLYDRRRRRLTGDVRYARFTRAGRAARHGLGRARALLRAGERTAFYDALAGALGDYLSAKLDLPPGRVTAETVGERLHAAGLPPAMAAELETLFAICEQARFAPAGDGGGDAEHALERAEALVRALERRGRMVRPMAAALWLVVVAVAAGAGAAGGETPNTIFFRANTLYGEQRYAEAAAAYEKILAGGQESGNLYFNLGNAYFRAGDTGRAILEYERARRLVPRDPDTRANLGYARSLAGEADDEAPVWARLVFPLAERLSSDELWLATSILYAAVMLVLAGSRLVPGVERSARPAALVLAALLAIFLSSTIYRLVSLDLPAWAVVVAKDGAPVRFEPSPSGTVYFRAKLGSTLELLAEREGWAQVARRDGRRGWIERQTLAPL